MRHSPPPPPGYEVRLLRSPRRPPPAGPAGPGPVRRPPSRPLGLDTEVGDLVDCWRLSRPTR